MSKVNDYFDILYSKIPGYLFGILTFVIGSSGFIIAILLSPEYLMWEKSISVLGHQTGGIFSRMGIIISNIIAIPSLIYLGRSLKGENVNEKIRKIAVGTGIFVSTIASLSGIVTGGIQLVKDIHGFFALLSWIGGITVCSLFGFLMLKSPKYLKSAANFSLVIAGIFGSFLVPFFITNFCAAVPDACGSFGSRVYTIMPIYEWIVMFSILTWYLFNSLYILKKKL
jgi:hypothetical protein